MKVSLKCSRQGFALAALAVAAVSCTWNSIQVRDELCPEISFSAGEHSSAASTKAMLTNDSFRTAGTQLAVWDEYTDQQGRVSDWIGSAVVESQGPNSTLWPFTNNEHYYWTRTGSHKFMGYLLYDAAQSKTIAEAYPGYSFDLGSKALTIPEHTTPLGYDWDFLFSRPYVRDMSLGRDFSPVPMTMEHLYSAFALCLKNDSPGQVQIDEILIQGIKNKASALISFSGNPTSGTWENGTYQFATGGGVTYTFDPLAELTFDEHQPHIVPGDPTEPKYIDLCPTPGATGNPFNSSDSVIEDYHMVWPQDSILLSNAQVSLTFTITVQEDFGKYSAVTPSKNNGRGRYVVDHVEAKTGGCYIKHDNATLGSGAYTFHGTYYEWVGLGQGNYNVAFKDGTPSSTVCGYNFVEMVTYNTQKSSSKSFHLQTPDVRSWEPGSRYLYLISHVSNEIDLDVKVLKWESVTNPDIVFGTVFDDNPGLKEQIGL